MYKWILEIKGVYTIIILATSNLNTTVYCTTLRDAAYSNLGILWSFKKICYGCTDDNTAKAMCVQAPFHLSDSDSQATC